MILMFLGGNNSGGPEEGHLKGGHLKMTFRSLSSLEKSNFSAHSKAIPQGKRHLDDTAVLNLKM